MAPQLLNVPLMNIKIIERYTVTSMSEGSRILTQDFDKILTLTLVCRREKQNNGLKHAKKKDDCSLQYEQHAHRQTLTNL